MTEQFRVGQGWDIHKLISGRPLVLGGVEVAHEKGLAGHSDADVLTHAIIDALLGSVADGDIGTLFPDTDPAWHDARSVELLATVVARIEKTGWRVVNVDATVVAEAPRIGPHREKMQAVISSALNVEPGAVSIKAKTAEGLGPEGSSDAISAQAVVLLKRRGG